MRTMPMLAALVGMLCAWPASAAGARETLDVAYVPGGGHKQQLDLYLPGGAGFPVVLYVHEGSLTSGDRKDADYPRIAEAFRAAGYGVAVMSYRLFPEHPWPAPVEDVASAIAWLRSHSTEWGGLPDRLFLVGHSSGATLVARVASDPRYLMRVKLPRSVISGAVVMGTILRDQDFEEALDRAARKGQRARMDSLFRMQPDYAIYGSVETYIDSWPLHHASHGMPPMLITVAEKERYQPPCLPHAEAFRDSARRVGARVEVEVLAGRDHSSAMRKLAEPGDPTFARILTFFKSTGR